MSVTSPAPTLTAISYIGDRHKIMEPGRSYLHYGTPPQGDLPGSITAYFHRKVEIPLFQTSIWFTD